MSIKLNKELINMVLPVYRGENKFQKIDGSEFTINSDNNIALETIYHDKEILIFKDFIYEEKSSDYTDCIFLINDKLIFIWKNGKYENTIENLMKEKREKEAYEFVKNNSKDIIKEYTALKLMQNI